MKKIIVSMYVFFLTSLTSIFEPLFFTLARKSLKNINESLIVLCLAKNNAKQLSTTLKRFSKIQNYFSDFKVLIYENNSTDKTKEVLKQAKNTYDFVEFYAFDYSEKELKSVATIQQRPDMKQCRIQHIAKGRNFLVEKLANDYSYFSTVLVFDSDVFYFNPYKIVSKVTTFVGNNFDVLSTNGLTKMFKYRDAYAFRSIEFPYGPEYLAESWWKKTVPKIQKRYLQKNFLSVYSAFGGAALYKTKDYIHAQYSALPTKDYFDTQTKISKNNLNAMIYRDVDILKPMENTGYTGPVVCEHVPFHYTFYKNGLTKQYLDTSWRMLFL